MNAKLSVLSGMCLLLIASCSGDEYLRSASAPEDDSADISEVRVGLPEAEGKELIERACVPCHSLRYIEMQPGMPKKSWDKIVTKMIRTYGAPVRDSLEAERIVTYLTAAKGEL